MPSEAEDIDGEIAPLYRDKGMRRMGRHIDAYTAGASTMSVQARPHKTEAHQWD